MKTDNRMEYWAIGDVHGESALLENLLHALPLRAEDGIVFLGDLVDRGPDTAGVLDQVLVLAEEREVVVLKGNHEQMMLNSRGNRASLPDWLAVGGEATLDAYKANSFDSIPAAHWHLLEQGRLYFETDSEIYVHANLDSSLPLSAQNEDDLLWKFYDAPIHHFSGKFVVCGHTPQGSGYPKLDDQSICIDTLDSPSSCWLTAVNVGRRIFCQVNGEGQRRSDVFYSLLD